MESKIAMEKLMDVREEKEEGGDGGDGARVLQVSPYDFSLTKLSP